MDKKDIKYKAILELLTQPTNTVDELMSLNRKIAKKYGIAMITNADLLGEYRKQVKDGLRARSIDFERILRKRAVRTMSGIAPVAVLTKPFACPGKCAYCPTEKDVPQSYLSNEPAVMRAIRCGYDPYVQVMDRLQALEANGHEPTKIELIVIGGTWSVLSNEYQYWYIASCFAAANEYKTGKKQLKSKIKISFSLKKLKEVLVKEQQKNEKSKYNIIGLTLETRPDYINEDELLEMRDFGCTRVELGVQAVDDEILKLNKRGHGVERVVEATALLRDFGFKVTYHLMPGLPGATAKKDVAMFKELFNSDRFQPDQIKFYPTVVTKGSLLYKWWQQGKYKPYTNRVLEEIIVKCKQIIPRYVRIIRLIRDIPGESIIAGNIITNLRQVMQQRGVECNCIRCREPREAKITDYKLLVTDYPAAGGIEYFIEACSLDEKTLYGFCRLRLPGQSGKTETSHSKSPIAGMAIIRELHVYGELVSVGAEKKVQHSGLGRRLSIEAEKIAKENNFEKMAVISGVGVRGYYRKNGFRLQNTYMIKSLKTSS